MIDMTGPGGREGCSAMECLATARIEHIYRVVHPGQKEYDVKYRWCSAHSDRVDTEVYPNFYLVKETEL